MPRADFTPHRPTDLDTIVETMDRHVGETKAALDRLGDVVSTDKVVKVTISKADTDVTVAHQLGYVPKHVSLGAPSSNARVWQSQPATKEAITLRADAPTSLTVLVS
jgi:hypothetical protein